jgi:hypothetical protein
MNDLFPLSEPLRTILGDDGFFDFVMTIARKSLFEDSESGHKNAKCAP